MAILPKNLNETYQKQSSNPVIQVILVLIVLVLFSWFLFRPRLATFNESRAQLKAAQNQLDTIESDQRDLDRLVKELRASKDEVAMVDEALPLNGRTSKTYMLLDNLVRSSGMSLAVISTDDTSSIISAGDKEMLANPFKSGRTLHTITISASVTGTMEQLKNLLQLMETNGRVLDVQSLQILGGDPVTKFRLTVKAYAYEKVIK